MKPQLAMPIAAALLASACGPDPTAREQEPVASPTPLPAQSKPVKPEHIVTVHYHRFDEAYDHVSLWTWDPSNARTPKDNELVPAGRDDFGVYFEIDRRLYGNNGAPQRIGLLPRYHRDWNRKDGTDKFWTAEMGPEVWLIGTQNRVYNQRPDISPRILGAHLDAPTRIALQVNRLLANADIAPDAFTVTGPHGRRVAVANAKLGVPHAADGRSFWVEITTAEALDVTAGAAAVALRKFGGPVEVVPRGVLDDRTLFFDANAELGATYTPEATVFRVFAPTAHRASVVLYDEATGVRGRGEHPMQPAGRGIWEKRLPGDLAGRFYTYRFEGPDLDPQHEVLDVCAKNAVASSTRARITDLAATNPPDWDRLRQGPPVASPVDAVIYELHVRDFTIAPNSGVQQKGLYTGWSEAGTRLDGDPNVKTCLDHLSELGVTHVQLLPVQDFSNDEAARHYNWGYITSAFWSPEGMYASDIYNDSRIRELKQLIAALHARGIGVILDVVYNHTGEAAPFNWTVPGYYYRKWPDGTFANGSGCGNEFRTEAPMARKFLIDSLLYWVREFGVDGFRFDLMALLDTETMREAEKALRAVRPDIILYGEPWMAAGSPLHQPTDKHGIRGTGIGAFNDNFRNGLKGSPDGNGRGWIQDGSAEGDVRQGITGTWWDWAESPAHSINYMTCHDNLVLYDKLKISMPGASEGRLLDAMKLGYLALLTAQGVPFIHGGCDFGRTKGGNHNSYDAPDSVNQIDWALKKKNRALFEWVRHLIALRKAHPVFRLRTKAEVAKRLEFLLTGDHRRIGFVLNGEGVPGESWKRVVVAMNTADQPGEFALPNGNWQFVLEENGPGQRFVTGGKITVRPKAGVILRQR